MYNAKYYQESVDLMARAFLRYGEVPILKELAKQWPLSVYPDALKRSYELTMQIVPKYYGRCRRA